MILSAPQWTRARQKMCALHIVKWRMNKRFFAHFSKFCCHLISWIHVGKHIWLCRGRCDVSQWRKDWTFNTYGRWSWSDCILWYHGGSCTSTVHKNWLLCFETTVKNCLFPREGKEKFNLFTRKKNVGWTIVIIKFSCSHIMQVMSVDNFMFFRFYFTPLSSSHVSESVKAKRWMRSLAAHLICCFKNLIRLSHDEWASERMELSPLWCVWVDAVRKKRKVKLLSWVAQFQRWWTTNTFFVSSISSFCTQISLLSILFRVFSEIDFLCKNSEKSLPSSMNLMKK